MPLRSVTLSADLWIEIEFWYEPETPAPSLLNVADADGVPDPEIRVLQAAWISNRNGERLVRIPEEVLQAQPGLSQALTNLLYEADLD